MDNEKNLMENENEEINETTEEITEEVVEEVVEEVDEEIAENADETEEFTDDQNIEATEEAMPAPKKVLKKVYLCDACGAVSEADFCPVCQKPLTKEEAYICKSQTKAEATKKAVLSLVAAIVAILVIVGAVFGGMYIYKEVYNKYNHGEYKELAFGDTLGEIAEELGMEFEELLESNGLPKDMGKSTYERIAINYIPIKNQAAQYGVDVNTFIAQAYGIEGEFDENITRGELEDQLTLKQAFGFETEEELAEFKTEYKLDDSVTMDTKFSEIRVDFYKAQYEQQKKAEEAEKAAEDIEEINPEDVTEEAPAENAEAPVEEAEAQEAKAEEAEAQEAKAE